MSERSDSAATGGPRVTRDQVRDLTTLRRSTDGRMVAGVADGIARHLDVDPILVRVLFGALAVFGGAGLVLYGILWLTVPADDKVDSVMSDWTHQDPDRVTMAGAAIAAAVGVLWMVGAAGFWAPNPFPVMLISLAAVAALAFVYGRREAGRTPTPSPEGQPPATTTVTDQRPDEPEGPSAAGGGTSPPGSGPDSAPVTPGSAPVSPTTAPAATPAAAPVPGTTEAPPATDPETARQWWQYPDSGREPASPSHDREGGPGGPAGESDVPPAAGRPRREPRRQRRPRSHLFGFTMAVIAIALGVVWILDETTYDVPNSVYPGTALGIVALALLVGTWFGRSRLLIAVGIVATLATVITAVIGDGPLGEQRRTPTSAADVEAEYEHAAGLFVLDLSEVDDVDALDGRTVQVDAGVGVARVVLPTSIDATVDAHVEGGEIAGPPDVQNLGSGERSAQLSPVDDADPDVTIDVDLNYGRIEIERLTCLGDRVETGQSNRLADEGGSDAPACD